MRAPLVFYWVCLFRCFLRSDRTPAVMQTLVLAACFSRLSPSMLRYLSSMTMFLPCSCTVALIALRMDEGRVTGGNRLGYLSERSEVSKETLDPLDA